VSIDIEPILQAFEAAGSYRGLIYVSVPITSGARELELLRALDIPRESIHEGGPNRGDWRQTVLHPNLEDALRFGETVRTWFPGELVVEPARFHVKGWTQADYSDLWTDLISQHAKTLVLAANWQFSRGARSEAATASLARVPLLDHLKQALTRDELVRIDRTARSQLASSGWTDDFIAAYLVPLFPASDNRASTQREED
jgi:hypothetical protein